MSRRRIVTRLPGIALFALAAVCSLNEPSQLQAQPPAGHYRFSGETPPGAIGSWRLRRGGPLSGYYQPIEVHAPAGTQVAFAADGTFMPLEAAPVRAGFLIGQVYRLRVANIPDHQGQEVFPTVEVIDRTYPPPGQALQFPVPIHISEEDLDLALSGKFVTRVIYIEDPRAALPVHEKRATDRWFDAGPTANPLEVADLLGRPVAVLRIGGRVPADPQSPDPAFLGANPPLMKYPSRPPQKLPAAGAPAGEQPPADQPPQPANQQARRWGNPLSRVARNPAR